MSFIGSYRFASIDQLNSLLMRISLTRQSTAFKFAHPNATKSTSDGWTLEFRWQQRVEQGSNHLFTVTQEQLTNNHELSKPQAHSRRESFIAKRSIVSTSDADGSAEKPQFIVTTEPKRVTRKVTSMMYVLANLSKKSRAEEELNPTVEMSLSASGQLVVCELQLVEDNYGFQLRVSPDFSNEAYTFHGQSDETYALHFNITSTPNARSNPGVTSIDSALNKRSTYLAKKMAEMSIGQPTEGQIRASIFGEIVSAVGFAKNRSVFILYTLSSPHGWTLTGGRSDNELNATFSSMSVPVLSRDMTTSKNVAHFGHAFHFNFTTTEPDNLPRMYFKVVHFDVGTERYHTLATGNVSIRESALVCVPLVKAIPKGFTDRLREQFLGGSPRLTGIVVGQKIDCDSSTVPAGKLWVRVQILRQSRNYRLEDFLIESRLRLLKSSGQTLSTVQVALSAFQEARFKMFQARQEQKQIVNSEVSDKKNHSASLQTKA